MLLARSEIAMSSWTAVYGVGYANVSLKYVYSLCNTRLENKRGLVLSNYVEPIFLWRYRGFITSWLVLLVPFFWYASLSYYVLCSIFLKHGAESELYTEGLLLSISISSGSSTTAWTPTVLLWTGDGICVISSKRSRLIDSRVSSSLIGSVTRRQFSY